MLQIQVQVLLQSVNHQVQGSVVKIPEIGVRRMAWNNMGYRIIYSYFESNCVFFFVGFIIFARLIAMNFDTLMSN